MAGEKLDVVPATGTCNRVDLIGRLGEQYDVSTDRED